MKHTVKDVEDHFSAVHEAHMETYSGELTKLAEWFRKDFPEATLRIESDWNRPLRSMVLMCTVITGKESTPKNQGLRRVVRRIPWDHWNDPVHFGIIMKNFQESLRGQIFRFANDHFNTERTKSG